MGTQLEVHGEQLSPLVLQSWSHATKEATGSIVLPDGCRDLIERTDASDRARLERWFEHRM